MRTKNAVAEPVNVEVFVAKIGDKYVGLQFRKSGERWSEIIHMCVGDTTVVSDTPLYDADGKYIVKPEDRA